MFERILVAVDGSPHTTKTRDGAAALALISGAPVRVLHVREAPFVGRAGEVSDETSSEAHHVVDVVVGTLAETGIDVSGTVRGARGGLAAAEILAEAEEWGATVIVIGSTGAGALPRILLGSTAQKVLHLSELPVLVIR